MWFSSLTPFTSSYRPEVASASEEALKRAQAAGENLTTSASEPSDPVTVELSAIAAKVQELARPIDVGQLSPQDAKGRYEQLNAMLRYGGLADNMTVAATFGDQKTDSLEVFLGWLKERGTTASNVEDANDRPSLASSYAPTLVSQPDQLAGELSQVAARVLEMSRPEDIGRMSPEAAKAKLAQLQGMQRYGATAGMGANATFKGEKTTSLDTYMSWLAERAQTARPENTVLPLPLDFKA